MIAAVLALALMQLPATPNHAGELCKQMDCTDLSCACTDWITAKADLHPESKQLCSWDDTKRYPVNCADVHVLTEPEYQHLVDVIKVDEQTIRALSDQIHALQARVKKLEPRYDKFELHNVTCADGSTGAECLDRTCKKMGIGCKTDTTKESHATIHNQQAH